MDTLPHSRYLAPWGTLVKHEKTIAIFVSLDLYYRYALVLPRPAVHAAADGQLAVAESGKA